MTSRRETRAFKRHDQTVIRRAALLAGAVLLVVGAGAVGLTSLKRDNGGAAETPVTIAAAGDLGGSANEIRPVANLMDGMTQTAGDRILLLGDLVYSDGDPADYASWFNDVYGPMKAKTIAAPGNHDYHEPNGAGFHGYYPTTIPHAFDLANGWTVITVNTEVSHGSGSTMEQQVKALADDARARGRHIIAITHHPRYTAASSHGDDTAGDAIFRDLDAAQADLYLAGHNHLWERYQPAHGGGVFTADSGTDGVRSFTAGTGGNGLYSCRAHAGRASCIDNAHGALRLKLYSDHYEWAFVTTSGQTLDAGSAPTRTGGSTSTTSSSSSSSSSTSSTSVSTSSTSTSTSTTTIPTGECVQHSGTTFTSAQWLHVVYSGCWQGGNAWVTDPWTAPWDLFHPSAMFVVRGPVTIKNTVAVNFGDGYHIEAGNGFLFDSVLSLYGHDDAIENDRHQSGTVKNSIFTSFVGYSDSGEDTSDGSARTVTLDGNLFDLYAIPSVYKPASYGTAPGIGTFWKLDANSARLIVRNNRFVARNLPPSYGSLGPPPANKIVACENNTVEWQGTPGGFPASAKAAWLAACPDITFIGI